MKILPPAVCWVLLVSPVRHSDWSFCSLILRSHWPSVRIFRSHHHRLIQGEPGAQRQIQYRTWLPSVPDEDIASFWEISCWNLAAFLQNCCFLPRREYWRAVGAFPRVGLFSPSVGLYRLCTFRPDWRNRYLQLISSEWI